MAIRPVRELPSRSGFCGRGDSYVAADMREFVRCGMDVAVIEIEGKNPKLVMAACKKYIKAHPDKLRGVRAGMRGGKAYVWREVER